MTKTDKPTITVLDIETAPLTSSTWGTFKQNVGLPQIQEEWAIISVAWKPLNDSTKKSKKADVKYMDTSDKDDLRDDFDVCYTLWKVLNESDMVVAQNGVKFDMRKIKARMIMHGLPPFSPVKVLDTLLIAKKEAAFTSNKLEWLADKFSTIKKSKHTEFSGFELWREYLAGNKKAATAMKRYNIDDVLSLEQVYLRLRPWASNHANVGVFNANGGHLCPSCGSDNTEKSGYYYTNVNRYDRYRCNNCLGWSRGRKGTTKKTNSQLLAKAI